MPLVLTNQEKLHVLKNRKQQLRLNWADLNLNLDLYENGSVAEKSDEAIASIKQTMRQVEDNLSYIEAQIEALEDVEMGEAVDLLGGAHSVKRGKNR